MKKEINEIILASDKISDELIKIMLTFAEGLLSHQASSQTQQDVHHLT